VAQIAIPPQSFSGAPRGRPGTVSWETLAPVGAANIPGLGFPLLLFFLFVIFSRFFDLYLNRLHIPGISERLMAVGIVVSGSFWRPIQTSIGKHLLLFTGWMVLGVPFSVWRKGSLDLLTGQWWACLLVFVAVGGLIVNFSQYRRSVMTMALAIFVLSLFCLHYGNEESGRLWMGNRSRFANPNEMAQAMLIGIPFWIALAKRAPNIIVRLFA
jgi:hypothetical protein